MNPVRLSTFVLCLFAAAPAAAADRYVSPHGSGARDGRSASDAYDASKGGLQKCLDEMDGGDACRLLGGIYENADGFVLRKGGSPAARKTITAADPADLPLLRGRRAAPYRPDGAAGGRDGFTLWADAGYVTLSHLRFENYRVFLHADGRNNGLHFAYLEGANMRSGFEITGDGDCTAAKTAACGRASHGLVFERVRIKGFSKRGIRLKNGVFDAWLSDCVMDSDFQDGDPFPVGYHVDEGPSRRIFFHRCRAGNTLDTSGQYPNGDGFAVERGARRIVFERCVSENNTDAGFDVKSRDTAFFECDASRNRRGYRLWSENGGVYLKRCLARSSREGPHDIPAAGVWVAGRAFLDQCRILGNTFGLYLVGGAVVRALRTEISESAAPGSQLHAKAGARLYWTGPGTRKEKKA